MTEKISAKPRHLGRGLEALMGPMTSPSGSFTLASDGHQDGSTQSGDNQIRSTAFEVPLESISPNPHQARTTWNEEKLSELAQSIDANGLVQPIVLRKTPTGYQLIAGERRFRAYQKLGKRTIPALVREATEEQMFELSLVENIHRSDLNPVERAKAYRSYITQFELTQTEAANRLGEDRSVLSNLLRILELPIDLQQLLAGGQLSMGHAKAILALPTEQLRRRLANRALAGRLSVRDVESMVRATLEGETSPAATPPPQAPHIQELEAKLSSHLGTRVSIKTRKWGHRGKLVIEFQSLDEFDHLLEMMGVQSQQEL